MTKHYGICCPFCYSDTGVSVPDDFDKNPYPIYCPECGECVNEDELNEEVEQ